MPYYPLPHSSEAPTGRSTSTSYDHHSASAIRPVDDYPSYEDTYGGDDNGAGAFVGSGREGQLLSFRSNEEGRGIYMGSQGERDDGEGYDSDISLSAANTQPLQPHRHSPYRPPPSTLRTQTPYEPDLDLHLTSPAPLYSSPGLSQRRGRYDDYGEDVKDPGEFEESFEAGRGGDDGDSDAGQGFDTPMSFQGGFGAPPAVRLPFFSTHFPSPDPFPARKGFCSPLSSSYRPPTSAGNKTAASNSLRATSSSHVRSRPVFSVFSRGKTGTSSRRRGIRL
jgi:hypothetical protein